MMRGINRQDIFEDNFVFDAFHHVLVSLHRKTIMPPIEERAVSDG